MKLKLRGLIDESKTVFKNGLAVSHSPPGIRDAGWGTVEELRTECYEVRVKSSCPKHVLPRCHFAPVSSQGSEDVAARWALGAKRNLSWKYTGSSWVARWDWISSVFFCHYDLHCPHFIISVWSCNGSTLSITIEMALLHHEWCQLYTCLSQLAAFIPTDPVTSVSCKRDLNHGPKMPCCMHIRAIIIFIFIVLFKTEFTKLLYRKRAAKQWNNKAK